VPPFHYIHRLANNTNTQRVEVGPQTFARQDHEKVVKTSTKMMVLPPYHYCQIDNPYIRRDERTREPHQENGQVLLRYGEREIRFWDDWKQPFPLLPGESLYAKKSFEIEVIQMDSAFRIMATRDFVEVDEVTKTETKRVAGDEWLIVGPKVYRPRIEHTITKRINAQVIEPNHALILKAVKSCIDSHKNERKAGEEWLVRETGTYLPSVNETLLGVRKPYFLVDKKALHLKATNAFTDFYGVKHKAGEEWLVTNQESEIHIQDIHEQIVGVVHLNILQEHEYCTVLNPVVDGKNVLGTKQLRRGVTSFFLYPGEKLAGNGIEKVHILRDNEAILLKSQETFYDESKEKKRNAGDLWLVHGPCAYTPRVEVKIIEKRKEMPMAANEGIYVRNIKTGEVRAIKGQTYMLEAHEEMWKKELPTTVEQQIAHAKKSNLLRQDKSKLVTFQVSYNAAVQIYDYKLEKSRVAFGPALVSLAPDEQFTIISLSGDTPKRPHMITTLELRLGPDFMTDVVVLETSDHARLKVKLSYNWHFKIDPQDPTKIFQVKDFVGDACKALASRVRGAVASTAFAEFHTNSARLIRKAVFGEVKETNKIKDSLLFTANQLCITNVDIQSVEPVDERTRESLQKSVQLAIEITTRKQERRARFVADEMEQKAKAELDRQKIINQKSIEEEKQNLVERQIAVKAVEAAGQAKAEANGRDIKLRIEADMSVKQAGLAVQASQIEFQAELAETEQTRAVEISHNKILLKMKMEKARALADIETDKFGQLVSIITPHTIQAIARSGPEMQARLLKGLGLKGYLMTDGNSPINLFNAAKGMVAAPNGM